MLATTAGLAAPLAAWRPALLVIKPAGAAYLVCLGLSSLRTACRPHPARTRPEGRRPDSVRPRTAFGQGVLSNLSNPKMAMFYITVLPQFADPARRAPGAMLAFGLVFSAMTFAWLPGYATVTARAGPLLRQPRGGRVLGGMCGATVAGLGIWLATEAGWAR